MASDLTRSRYNRTKSDTSCSSLKVNMTRNLANTLEIMREPQITHDHNNLDTPIHFRPSYITKKYYIGVPGRTANNNAGACALSRLYFNSIPD